MKKGWYWPLLIVAFLVGDVFAMGLTVYFSSTDESHHVIPDYYEKAVAYDETMDKQRRLQDLGWAFDIVDITATDAALLVDFRLADRDGAPIGAARGEIHAYQQAHAADALSIPLKEGEKGTYRAILPARRTGLWIFDVELQHQDGAVAFQIKRDL